MASNPPPAPRFFVLEVPASGHDETDFFDVDDNVGDSPRCPQCNAGLGSLSWLPPYRGELDLVGEGFGDLVRGRLNGKSRTRQ